MMMKPYSHDLRQLDALYSVELTFQGFDLIVESRGGSDHGPNPSRNRDYADGLELHLSRMGDLGMVLVDIHVASSVAMKMPEVDRRVSLDGFVLPLRLNDVVNVEALRLSIGRASAAFGRTDGSDRGNRTKRMRLRMQWPGAAGMSAEALGNMLGRPVAKGVPRELPTADPDELADRVVNATRALRTAAKRGIIPSPPPGQKKPIRVASAPATRFVRDPNVIAWVLDAAGGSCEVCGRTAPFRRDDGSLYLEVHHVRPLGEGGPDTVDNAVACCPNCHRQLHFDSDRARLRQTIIGAITRLADHPLLVQEEILDLSADSEEVAL
jgi:5-methylcytosine-specific restriction enzyme A